MLQVATLSNDGIVNIPGSSGTGVFAVATVNMGASASITVSADTGIATLASAMAATATGAHPLDEDEPVGTNFPAASFV